MSRLRLNKIAAPANPAASKAEIYYDTTGLGTPATPGIVARDESGNLSVVANFATGNYKVISVRVLTSGTSYVPTAGTRALYVECIGGGGAGGGAATSSTTVSVGGGGGGGAYAASFLTGAQIKNPTAYVIGAAGTAGGAGAVGGNGGDTTWDTTVIVAKGGTGGPVLAAAGTLAVQIGGAGGAAGSSTGTLTVSGSIGDKGVRLSTTQGWSGDGGAAAFMGTVGANGVAAVAAGAGTASAATAYGSGGSGGATISTASAGGGGAAGVIRVWELA